MNNIGAYVAFYIILTFDIIFTYVCYRKYVIFDEKPNCISDFDFVYGIEQINCLLEEEKITNRSYNTAKKCIQDLFSQAPISEYNNKVREYQNNQNRIGTSSFILGFALIVFLLSSAVFDFINPKYLIFLSSAIAFATLHILIAKAKKQLPSLQKYETNYNGEIILMVYSDEDILDFQNKTYGIINNFQIISSVVEKNKTIKTVFYTFLIASPFYRQ